MGKIEFSIKEFGKWNVVKFELDDSLIPSDLPFIIPPKLTGTKGAILSGRGPIWLYGFLIHHYHPTKFIAVYDPRLGGAVVIETHTNEVKVGEVIKAEI